MRLEEGEGFLAEMTHRSDVPYLTLNISEALGFGPRPGKGLIGTSDLELEE